MRYFLCKYFKEGKIMDLKDIQIRLRECISASSLTQKEIAKAVGVSAQTISKYMKQDIFPALDTLAKLCKVLDVKSDYILGLESY
jgi:transcriptional regulator with XRE-family HTH domain